MVQGCFQTKNFPSPSISKMSEMDLTQTLPHPDKKFFNWMKNKEIGLFFHILTLNQVSNEKKITSNDMTEPIHFRNKTK